MARILTDSSIQNVFAWEVLDSRGQPTVSAEVRLRGGACGVAAVPSGTSKGRYEAAELRDNGLRYGGMGVATAVRNANTTLREAVLGLNSHDQPQIDSALTQADGTPSLGRVGANAVLAVSLANLLASAAAQSRPVWSLGEGSRIGRYTLPVPLVNLVSGGAHADSYFDIQDILAIPAAARSFSEAAEICSRARKGTGEAARARGLTKRLLAESGRLETTPLTNDDALRLAVEGIERAGLQPGKEVVLGIDVAASQLFQDGRYKLQHESCALTSRQLMQRVTHWTSEYPIAWVEDVLAEDEWDDWLSATNSMRNMHLVGDDLFATKTDRLRKGIELGIATGALVKPNQCGTITGTAEFVETARTGNYTVTMSDRSGETDDSWLSDLSVFWKADHLKLGSTMRSERTAKWNRLLEIEARLEGKAKFVGWRA